MSDLKCIPKVAIVISFLSGCALTLIALDLWGAHLDRVSGRASPFHVFRPLNDVRFIISNVRLLLNSSKKLPAPWLPETSGPAYQNWGLRTLAGRSIQLSDLRGRVVFLSFWSTTCAPCVAELPGIEALRDSLKDEPVEFLAVTSDPQDRVEWFLHRVPFHLPVYLAGPLPANMQPQPVPTTLILDRGGSAVFAQVGALNWDTDEARAFIRRLASQ